MDASGAPFVALGNLRAGQQQAALARIGAEVAALQSDTVGKPARICGMASALRA